ncbi:olfactory receptor 5V1-like [Rhinatrema bivittatum]|uniref:olfactory receptor 5V1-like n=1 Tax=Rhinatrema bivittatum TaxID=194408 RepID=UPI00112D0CA8|nr:olfactory receptor 5V1-like [Rhinatrema bivittatum]XP_029442652.1 olfactory receptor 5V1-like [Rhinatrema bivittatum]
MQTAERKNQTSIAGFILLGFSDHPQLQVLIITLVFLIFLSALLGNGTFLTLMCADPRLHRPMYFFLSNLSCLDICYTLTTLPRILGSLFMRDKSISFLACVAQLFLFMSFTIAEFVLLAVMAYDRYVAICNPFHYALIMSNRVCTVLAASSWIIGFLGSSLVTDLIAQSSFCGSNEINHFFCDLTAMIKLICGDIHSLEVVISTEGVFLGINIFLLTLISYTCIISSILKIPSMEGKRKAFSTCSSHLIVVVLFYGTVIFYYMRPQSMYSPEQDKLFSLLYTGLVPMLNPMIYSLRNKEINNALRKVRTRNKCFQLS